MEAMVGQTSPSHSQTTREIALSVLDLATIFEGSSPADAFKNSLAIAQHAEQLNFKRFWLAEHHNMANVASAATAVVIGHVAAGTKRIRVGSGGVMLPNHSPLVIAEQFGTLESLYPGRIDLGLGRAPGTDGRTAMALRRDLMASAERFPEDVRELQTYFAEPSPGQYLRAIPGAGLHIPLWLLGSSTFSAQLAAKLGLPFAFAAHFAPTHLFDALQLYHQHFQPSAQLAKPYTMVAINVIGAETDAEAQYLFTSIQQAFLDIQRGTPRPIPAPTNDPAKRQALDFAFAQSPMLTYTAIGTLDTLEQRLSEIIKATAADEIMVSANIYDQAARIRSFEIVAAARDRINAKRLAQ